MLHYLEGDSVPLSHLLPLHSIYFQTLNNLPLSVTIHLDADDITSINDLAKERCLGAARKIGFRHNVHCLAFCLDVYVRALVMLIFGESELLRIQRTFTDKALLDAIKNYYVQGASDEDEEGELDLAEPEIADSRLAFECPSGFSVIEKPAAFISSAQGLKDLYIAMLWKEEGWELGKTLRNPILEVSWGVSHPQVLASHPERDLFLWKVGAEAERVG
ncbi:hypothetical protein CYMTET_16762 [Cymbomonas tetramitiformis]|uniref:Uncharacterized protein n=1 Tax=Cymbomonas tetramitiformis TaxID=36881 RepID=A0AAE0L7T8_9CHLO|nr:hypothetical protein CYMTET_16762 [Cymbomonas tetramitiformis]